jgi:RNA polymerase sigma-70 factor (ECF subfamily)
LTPADAEDAVQETLLTVLRKLPGFRYDPVRGRFRGWLLQIVRWRVGDQFRKRKPAVLLPEDDRSTAAIERVPDPGGAALDAFWEREYAINLVRAALRNIEHRVRSKQHYRIFWLQVLEARPVAEVAAQFGVSTDSVYQIKHRLLKLVSEEARRLEREGI